jgi:hypothetical protein
MRTPARRSKAALAIAFFALVAWGAGWSLHARHALGEALGGGLAEICTARGPLGAPGDESPAPRHTAQCPICAQFLAAAAPHAQLAAPAGLLGFAEHEAIVPRAAARLAHASLESADARAPPTAA